MKKKWTIVVLIVVVLWLAAGITDFARVTDFEKPLFCVLTNGADDGGSGTYIGLGYSFDIQGNFMPEDELPGVTCFTAKLFGMTVTSGIRD